MRISSACGATLPPQKQLHLSEVGSQGPGWHGTFDWLSLFDPKQTDEQQSQQSTD
ncbi:MAG: hypothetical protein J0M26_28630 [Planctomycetes bacterium]|nr:hypothetical protein [Planctomycetota bacterium]